MVAFCVFFLSLPYLYGKASDRWLGEMGRVRAVQQGMLREKGQVNALYQNRFLTNTTIETSADADQTRKELVDRTETLATAGVLSRAEAERACEILGQPGAQTSSKLENGFYSAIYWAPDHEGRAGERIQVTLQEKTGLVTFYSVSADKGREDLDESLNAYRD